jgi:magnesium transporter
LAYALIDLIVDNYFAVLEVLGNKIQQLEDDLIRQADTRMLNNIYGIKRNLLLIRRHVWPLREVVFRLNRDNAALIQENTQVYLRDLYDHVIRVTDHIETYRESITGMHDIYLSSLNNKMNEVMKVLTVISTIFIPMTLVASIYGMDLDYMPEKHWTYTYPLVLAVMAGITITLLAYFRRLDWI